MRGKPSSYTPITVDEIHFNANPLPLGTRYGKLTLVSYVRIRYSSSSCLGYVCKCDCGNTCINQRGTLNDTKSCGCWISALISAANKRHGMSNTKIFRTWGSMLRRCDPTNMAKAADGYARRGIKVCKRWQKFENFYADMGEIPAGMTLDRINNNGHYTPKNCRWADRSTQAKNKRCTRRYRINGQTKTVTEWADHYGIHYQTADYRMKVLNWSPKRAFCTPVRVGSRDQLRAMARRTARDSLASV